MQDFLNLKYKNTEKEFFLQNGLYIVSTPIGNIYDITLRAIETLKKCDYIICENSKVSAKLLNFFQIKKPLIIYNDHSSEDSRLKILKLIKEGSKSLCLISDAGTPLISDPGYKLVNFLMSRDVKINSIPGACSVIAALSISGMQSDKFLFCGFIPNIKSQKEIFLKNFVEDRHTLIFFESPQRVKSTLEIMLDIFGNRSASVVREITKIYEEVKKDNIENLLLHFKVNEVKGEVVILIDKEERKTKEIDFNKIDKELLKMSKITNSKDAIATISENYNINKKIIYKRFLNIKNDNSRLK